MPQIVAFAGPAGPAFSFSAFLLPARPLVCVDGAGFLSSRFAAVLDSFTTGSHGPNRACLGLRWCRSPTRPPKPHTGPHRVEFFLSITSLPLPPFRGRGWVSPVSGLLVFSRREARCFSAGKDGYYVSEGFSRQLPAATAAHKRLTRLQQGRSGAFLASFPYPASKTAHRASQARVWFSPPFPGALLLRQPC